MVDLTGKAAGRRPRSLWQGRAGRKAYWIWIGVIFAVAILLSMIGLKSGSSATTILLAATQARRLRDFGRSGWWALAIVVVQFGATIAAMLLVSMDVGVLVGLVATVVPAVWLGVLPGDPHENRFGPPVGSGTLKDVFS